jgi:very-short-patch-repair endonuclease
MFQSAWARAVELARKQHGVVSREQLLRLGWTESAIKWARRAGRLYRTEWRGVYVLGRPDLTKHGRLRAALLTAGDDAALSDASGGELWNIWKPRDRLIHLSLPAVQKRRDREGIKIHRRALKRNEITHTWGIRVTTPLRTIVDLAPQCDRRRAERLINTADARNVIRADILREGLDSYARLPGVPLLIDTFDHYTLVLTESEAERLLVPLAVRAGLGTPASQVRLGRGRVDFWFPHLNLVVECDSLRYHRTVQQQAEDHARDHTHFLDRRERVRVFMFQIKHDPEYVVSFLTQVRLRLTPGIRAVASRA